MAEINDLDVALPWVEGIGHIVFGGNAYGATSVVENDFRLHSGLSWVAWCYKRSDMVGTVPPFAKRALSGSPLTFWCKLLEMNAKNIFPPTKPVYRQLEDVVGCKWSISVLLAIAAGVARPGALERHIQGISTKVLSERLRKLTSYGLLVKHTYAEVPPRTEYSLTPNGHRLVSIVGQIRHLDDQIRTEARPGRTERP